MSYLIRRAAAIFSSSFPAATDIRIRDNRIVELGTDLPVQQDEHIINANGCVVWPGLVNTHHHLAQSILKGVPAGLNQGLGEWLGSVPYRFWPKITPTQMYHAARLGLYEMLRSGVTTCADHHYLYHHDTTPELEDAVWQAADELGIRLVLCRGFATEAGTHKGMARHNILPETLQQVVDRLDHSRKRYHQPQQDAMRRLVVAPTSLIHSSRPDTLEILAQYAKCNGLRRHSHLLEVAFDEHQSLEKYGMPAIDYAAERGWLGSDVWFAHLVHSNAHVIERLADTGSGIAHCPTSNCRLGSGIAPVPQMAKAGVPISLGVDGSASSESGSMLQELNLAWLLHRAVCGPEATTLEQMLEWGSKGGAEVLGLKDIGEIKVGQAADIVIYDIARPRFAGIHSPLMAPLLCAEPAAVWYSFINGRPVIEKGQLKGLDEAELTRQVQLSVAELLSSV
ncbi:amidohydrolase family protein [Halomonas sp. PAMB 3232]|uniref:amidohydrolase family protein n=1 Tax=Halomonas sp. PAMB 3232 TaxID=3075221 RepID=UPI0028A1DB90|nr:amidohydrolase family protein [Halomonas sp. PAMB 3232]WNL39132.1 amidohydrolase family protein [Halomonas sp. PAMB 3232]